MYVLSTIYLHAILLLHLPILNFIFYRKQIQTCRSKQIQNTALGVLTFLQDKIDLYIHVVLLLVYGQAPYINYFSAQQGSPWYD